MLSLWTTIHLAMTVAEFAKLDNYMVPDTMPFGYFMLLLLYVIKKGSDLWLNIHWQKRKGEFYLVAWFVVMMMMYIIQFVTDGAYVVPKSMLVTIIGIVIAYTGSMVSTIAHYLVTSDEGNGLVRYYLKNRYNNKPPKNGKKAS